MMTFGEFALKLERAIPRIEPGMVAATESVVKHAATEAKRVIGTYEYGWPQLAERTQETRAYIGYPENEPLLRSGEMRDDISTKAEAVIGGAEGLVYSNEKKALWAEMGTNSGQPPRSFLFRSLWLANPTMSKVFAALAESFFI